MGKRLAKDYNMEIAKIHEDLSGLKKQVDEVLFLLGGSAAYEYKGMRAEFKELKEAVGTVQTEIEKIKKVEADRWNLSLKTVPQKFAAVFAFVALVISMVSGIKELFTQ
jgi:uncharacterized protein YukE